MSSVVHVGSFQFVPYCNLAGPPGLNPAPADTPPNIARIPGLASSSVRVFVVGVPAEAEVAQLIATPPATTVNIINREMFMVVAPFLKSTVT